ncbi:hypothetical protein D7X88_16055 [bacterium C-53]|nr:hypothetical protein [Lachnospiraceae bacterium]NBI04476.1 hypothetical protein [Lachnospiraceae bacterium]RKJ08148.1 hypothetical protein D7X88_16055 [bacterium C-53]
MKNHTDVLIFHTAICAGASQISLDGRRKLKICVALSHKRSGMEIFMTLLGLEWYWWLVIVVVLAISIPFKIKFMKWWSKREQEKKKELHGKWGDDE